MYRYTYRRKPSYAPLLSMAEIESIALHMLQEYDKELLRRPQAIDVEDFAQNYLKAHFDYQYLSNNGIYLGMTVFDGSDRVIVYNPDENCADYITEDANTIIIDNRLLDKKQKTRCRFTVGHEAGHVALPHKDFFRHKAEDAVACRNIGRNSDRNPEDWTDEDWVEWQADHFSSAILMPAPAVKIAVEELMEWGRFVGTARRNLRNTNGIVNYFKVPKQAAEIRLKQLGLWERG